MDPVDDALTCRLRADLGEVAALADAVAAWAERLRVPRAAAAAMALMLEEIVTNCIRHGYAACAAIGEIEVRLETDGATLVAEVRDTAPAFDPLSVPAPDTGKSVEERAVGGLGIALIRRLAHRADYRRGDGRNVIRVVRNFEADDVPRN